MTEKGKSAGNVTGFLKDKFSGKQDVGSMLSAVSVSILLSNKFKYKTVVP